MKYKRFTTLQKQNILWEALSSNKSVVEICKKHGISRETYYKWKAQSEPIVGPITSRIRIADVTKSVLPALSPAPKLSRKEERIVDQAAQRISRFITKEVALVLHELRSKDKNKRRK